MRRQIWMLCIILAPLFLGLAGAAIEDEPTLGGKPLEHWVKRLKTSQKPEERQQAAFVLMMFGDRAASAVPDLIAALDDPEEDVRDYAIGALTGLGGLASKAVPALAARLGDDRLNGGGWDLLHHPIFNALAAIGEPAVPALIRALGSQDIDVQYRAADILRMIGVDAKAATEALAKHGDDPNETVALTCLKALQAIGPEARAAIPTLSALLRQTEPRSKDDVELANPRFESLVRTQAALGAEPDPILIQELESNGPLNRHMALILIREYGPRARAQAGRVERLLADPDEDIRAEAVETLCRIDPPGTVAIDRSVAALSSPDPKLRLEAARLLTGAKEAMPALTRALQDPDRQVRVQAALAIAETDPTVPAAVEILTESLRRSLKGKNEYQAFWIPGALGNFGPLAREAIPVLGDQLKGFQQIIDSDSLEALIWIDPSGESAAHALAGALATTDKQSRLTLLESLANLGPRASAEVPEIVKLLKDKDEDEEIRREAAITLGRIGPAAMTAVHDLMILLRDDQPYVRSAVIESLGQILPGGREAPPGLIDALRRDVDLGGFWSIIALIHLDPQFHATAARLAQADEDLHSRAVIMGALGHETFEGQAFTRRTIRDLDRIEFQDHIGGMMGHQDFTRPKIRELDPGLETKRGFSGNSDDSRRLASALEHLANLGAGARSALPWVARAMKNSDPRIRRAAEFAFDQIQKSPPKN